MDSKSLENALSLIVNSETNLEIDAGWREFNLQHFAYSDGIRKLRCCVDDNLGLTGLISCYALKDLCLISLAEPSVKVFELNASLDELVSLSLNGLILNLKPSSGQLPSFPSLRVLSLDIKKFNDNEHPNWSMPAFLSALISNCPKIEEISLIDETHVHQSCAEITIPSTCLRLTVNTELLTDCRVMENLKELIVDASSLEYFIACNKFLSQNLSLNLQNFCLRTTEFEEA